MTEESGMVKLLVLAIGCIGLAGAALAQDGVPDRRGQVPSNQQPIRSIDAERALMRAGGGNAVAARLNAANAYLVEGVDNPSKLAAARRHVDALLEDQPANGEALLLAAQIEMLSGEWRTAANYYRRATAAVPNDPAAYLGLGDALTRLGDEKGAARAFVAFREASGMEPLEDD